MPISPSSSSDKFYSLLGSNFTSLNQFIDSQNDEPISNHGSFNKIEQPQKIGEKLKGDYSKWKDSAKDTSSLIKQWFGLFEYVGNNKNNIVNLSKYWTPAYSNAISDVATYIDDIYKWADCLVPLSIRLFRYGYTHNIKDRLEELHTRLKSQPHDQQNQHLHSSSLNSETNKMMQQFQSKMENDASYLLYRILSKFIRLLTKIGSLYLSRYYTQKTAATIGKCFYEIYKNYCGRLDYFQSVSLQEEWLFHLQTHFVCQIECENPSSKEADLLNAQAFAQDELLKKIEELEKLGKCETIEKVHAIFKKLNFPLQIPATIEKFKTLFENPRFRRNLLQNYYCQENLRILMDDALVHGFIGKQKLEHENKIDYALPIITDEIKKCQEEGMSFDQIREHFAKLHIHFDAIRIPKEKAPQLPPDPNPEKELLPPPSEQTLGLYLSNEEYIKALTKEWIGHQEATAQLVLQGLRQAILSKHEVESEFMLFKAIQHGIGYISPLSQLGLCHPKFKESPIGRALELLVTDIAKLGIPSLGVFYVFSPLYSQVKFKIESLFILLAKHFVAFPYKPNEYSLESYKLTLQIRMTKLILFAYSLQFFIKKGLIWVNINLIERSILRLKNQTKKNSDQFEELALQYKNYENECNKKEEELKSALNELKRKDVNYIINKHSQTPGSEDRAIEHLVEMVLDANIDYFPPLVIEFIENHIGFTLTNESKVLLKSKLYEFFLKKEYAFVAFFSSNRSTYESS